MDQEEFTDQRQDLCPKDTKRVSNMCLHLLQQSYQFSSVAESCPTLCDTMTRSMPGLPVCWEQARDIPLMTKVMRKEPRHTQRWDQASGVPPDILEHLPSKNQSLPTLLLCALTSDFTGGCPPPPSHSLCQRVNLQLQLMKFLGN